MNPFRRTVEYLYRLYYNFHIEGRENIPEKEGLIIACNHRSYADPVFVTMPMKGKMRYMAKEELFKNAAFRWLITSLGAFPVKRGAGDMQLISDCAGMVKEGYNLVIFPEGTRQKENKVGRGKTGVALIASRSGADVLPMAVVFEEPKLHFRCKVTLKIGKVIPAEEIRSEDGDRQALNAAKKRIMDAITELVEGDKPDADEDGGTGADET